MSGAPTLCSAVDLRALAQLVRGRPVDPHRTDRLRALGAVDGDRVAPPLARAARARARPVLRGWAVRHHEGAVDVSPGWAGAAGVAFLVGAGDNERTPRPVRTWPSPDSLAAAVADLLDLGPTSSSETGGAVAFRWETRHAAGTLFGRDAGGAFRTQDTDGTIATLGPDQADLWRALCALSATAEDLAVAVGRRTGSS
ncbi:MAG: hypothetical protein ACR2JF_02750 [Iamia sp.]